MTEPAGRPADGEQDEDTRASGDDDSADTTGDAPPRTDASAAGDSRGDDSSDDGDDGTGTEGDESETEGVDDADEGDSDTDDSGSADDSDHDDTAHDDTAGDDSDSGDEGSGESDSGESDSDEGDSDEGDSDEGDSDSDEGDASEGDETTDADDSSEPLVPPLEPAPFVELLAAYRQPATAGAERLPWSWSTLSPAEMSASAAVLDGFVASYNRTWAITDEQTVPPCWHRHPALAHDLATLAWAYYHAYRDPTATPDRALGFQSHLPGFAERIDRWLGAERAECRAGRHTASWVERPVGGRGTSPEDDDAVLLLGEEDFGFGADPDRSAVR
ncbi:hypothetical protein ACVGOW_17495 [Pseudonocardia saturnea]